MNRPSRGDVLVGDHDAVERELLPPDPAEANASCHVSDPSWCLRCSPGNPRPKGSFAPGFARRLHELLHLLELRQQLIDFLHRAAGALGDPASAASR